MAIRPYSRFDYLSQRFEAVFVRKNSWQMRFKASARFILQLAGKCFCVNLHFSLFYGWDCSTTTPVATLSGYQRRANYWTTLNKLKGTDRPCPSLWVTKSSAVSIPAQKSNTAMKNT